MEKKSLSIKKTIVKKSERKPQQKVDKRMNNKISKILRALPALLATSLFLFCYRKRKTLFTLSLLAALFVTIGVSYKYVQAKMDETDSFSDTYILEKVSKHVALPSGKPLSLVRVEDPARLQKENPFYTNVKEGDYILAYPKLFIIYDAVHDEIEGTLVSSKKE